MLVSSVQLPINKNGFMTYYYDFRNVYILNYEQKKMSDRRSDTDDELYDYGLSPPHMRYATDQVPLEFGAVHVYNTQVSSILTPHLSVSSVCQFRGT